MKKTNILSIILVTLIAISITSSAYAVPMSINYQGKLTDPNGSVLNGEYQMSFSLFNTDTNGTTLWSEQQKIIVADGIYNVQLGAVNPLSADIFDNDALFLEVRIESETLLPRHKLTSVAFAIRAQEAESVGGFPVEDLVTEVEFDNKITTRTFTDDQIPDDITVNYAMDADKVDGKHASEFGDGHSLDAADGAPVDAVYVDNEGKVGIGTTQPTGKLHVYPSDDLGGGLTRGDIITSGNTLEGSHNIAIGNTNIQARKGIDTVSALDLNFFGGDVLIRSGNVGIGTTSPKSKLHVEDAIAWDNRVIQLTDSTAPGGFLGIEDGSIIAGDFIPLIHGKGVGTGIPGRIGLHLLGEPGEDGSDDAAVNIQGRLNGVALINAPILTILNYSTELMRIAASGNVGIGTTSPGSKLEVAGNVEADGFTINGEPLGTSSDTYWSENSGNIFYGGGNVGIGTMQPISKLHIDGWSSFEVNAINTPFASSMTNATGKTFYVSVYAKNTYHDSNQNANNEVALMGVSLHGTGVYGEGEVGIIGRGRIAGYFDGAVSIVDSNGDGKDCELKVNGPIYQRGSLLHADYVFEPEYNLESIEEHSKYMWENKHLKAIPKAKADKDGKEIIEAGAHRKGIVEELEKAHIYIEQLHKQNKALETLVHELSTRIEALESNN